MELPNEHVQKICKYGQGEATCSFLIMGTDFECAKRTPFQGPIDQCRAQGTMVAKANNCSGPPHFSTTSPDPRSN